VIEGGDRTSDSRYLAMMGYDYPPDEPFSEHIDYPNSKADARFIAAAITLVPELVDAITERDERIAELEAGIERLGSSESFTEPFALSPAQDQGHAELIARIEFARALLSVPTEPPEEK
jgi:hypothetical protein